MPDLCRAQSVLLTEIARLENVVNGSFACASSNQSKGISGGKGLHMGSAVVLLGEAGYDSTRPSKHHCDCLAEK